MYSGIKTCIDVKKLLDYIWMDAFQALGVCCDRPDCHFDFGTNPHPDGRFIKNAARVLRDAEKAVGVTCREFRKQTVPYPSKIPFGMREPKGIGWKTVRVRDKAFRQTAIRGITDFGEATLSYTGDKCFVETAVATIAADLDCNLDEIYGWFTIANPYLDTDDLYRIKPTAITYDGTTVSLTFDTRDLIKPELFTPMNAPPCEHLNICACEFTNGEITNPDVCPFVASINIVRLYENTDDCAALLHFDGNKPCSEGCLVTCEYGCTSETHINGMVRIRPSVRLLNDVEYEPRCEDCIDTSVYSCESRTTLCSCQKEPAYVTINYVTACAHNAPTLRSATQSYMAQSVACGDVGAALALAASYLRIPQVAQETSIQSMYPNEISILHAVEKLGLDGVLSRKWEYVPDPLNPVSRRLKGIQALVTLGEEKSVADGVFTETAVITLARNLSCIDPNQRVTISGYGSRWWRIGKISANDGGMTLFLTRTAK